MNRRRTSSATTRSSTWPATHGHVSTSGETFCLVDIELDDTWIQLETKTPPPDDTECQRVTDLASTAIEHQFDKNSYQM